MSGFIEAFGFVSGAGRFIRSIVAYATIIRLRASAQCRHRNPLFMPIRGICRRWAYTAATSWRARRWRTALAHGAGARRWRAALAHGVSVHVGTGTQNSRR